MQIYVVAGVAYWWQSGTEAMLAERSFKNYVDPNYPTLTPHPLEWPNMDIFNILSTLCYVTLRGLPTDPPPPFFVHVVIEWPLRMLPPLLLFEGLLCTCTVEKNTSHHLKVSKFRKQIFQPKLLPKNKPRNLFFLSWLLIRIEKQIWRFGFWKKFWLENLFSIFTDL